MPRVTYIQTDMTAGEISPRLRGRVDIQRYAKAVLKCENALPFVHGGARRRYGTRWIGEVKDSDVMTRLLPFIFSTTQAFIIEMGDQYARFFANEAPIMASTQPYELVTGFEEDDLPDLKYVQGADTMIFAHEDFEQSRLVRYANTNWKLSTIDFDPPPASERGERPNTILTLGATTGSGVTAAGASDVWKASDVGRFIESGSGRARIATVVDDNDATVDIIDAFASTSLAALDWTITESPKTTMTPSASAVGAACTLTAGADAFKEYAAINHEGSFIEINGGLVEIVEITNDTVATGTVRSALSGTTAAQSESWALLQPVWNSIDGYPRSVTLFEQRLCFGGSPGLPQTIWGSKSGEYFNMATGTNDDDAISFTIGSDQVNPIEHLASIRALLPLTYGGEFSMFGGIEKPLAPTNVQIKSQTVYGASKVRPVRVGGEMLFVQRSGRKLRALGPKSGTDISGGSDAFSAPDLSILAEHITESGIKEMAFAQEPDQIVWLVRNDGVMVTCSIDRDQDVIAFARQITDGEFESVATIPYNDMDQVWVIVKREINGFPTRFIEVFDPEVNMDCAVLGEVPAINMTSASWAAGVVTVLKAAHGYSSGDYIRIAGFTPEEYNGDYEITVTGSGSFTYELATDPGATTVVGTAQKGATVWSGLDHLEAKEVQILGDGQLQAPKTVTGGSVTIDEPAFEVEIGLNFVTTITPLPPEFGTGQGSAQGNAMSTHEVTLRLYNTIGGKVNDKPIEFRGFGEAVLNQPLTPFTGDKKISKLGWGRAGGGDDDGTFDIVQDQPLPFTLLAIIRKMTANDG